MKTSGIAAKVITNDKKTTVTTIKYKDGDDENSESPLFDQKLINAVYGLEPYYLDHLKTRVSKAKTCSYYGCTWFLLSTYIS
ncbi:MAG TPA: hypothetical protein VIP70_13800 [Nitrososphaeraceae archaeon]